MTILGQAWTWIWSHVDASWVDVLSLVTGALYAWIKHRKKTISTKKFVSKSTAIDFANGTGLFPLMVLTASVLSSMLLNELLHASRITLAIGGLVGIFSILDD